MLIRSGIVIIISLHMLTANVLAASSTTDKDNHDSERWISAVTVDCSFIVDIPQPVQDRIKKTLIQTLERILPGTERKSIGSYMKIQDAIESSIKRGLNIALEPKGYAIDTLKLTFGETTQADFSVKPFRRYVKNIQVSCNTENFHPFWTRRINSTFSQAGTSVENHYKPLLLGLPVDAEDYDWAFDIVRDESLDTSYLSEFYPDMNISVEVEIGDTAHISIALEPEGSVVQTLRVRTYSRSMFQLTLEPLKELVSSHSDIVVGMPLPLLQNSKEEIESEFSRLAMNDPIAKKFQIQTNCRLYFLDIDPNSAFLELHAESRNWHFRAEAMIDVGNDENPDEFESHLGIMMGENFECFLLVNFFPDDIRFRPDIGIGFLPFPTTFFAAGWDWNDGVGKLYLEQFFSRDIRFEAEVFTENLGQDQYGLVYKPFQFVSFGLFSDGDDDYWLRAAFAF